MGAPSLAELSGALPTLRARLNHGFSPGSRRGGWFAPDASRCLPAVPVPGTEGLGDGPGTEGLPGMAPSLLATPFPQTLPPFQAPILPGMTLPCSLKMETGESWGGWGGLRQVRSQNQQRSPQSVSLIGESVGWERGCTGMLKKQQISTK